mgnify:CR=1 FL=1
MRKKLKCLILIIVCLFIIIGIYIYYNYKQAENEQEKSNYELAISYYKKVELIINKAKEQEKECYYKRGIQLRDEKDFDKAIECFNKVIDYKDTMEQMQTTEYQYGIYSYQIGQIEKAKKYLEKFRDNNEIKEYLKNIDRLLQVQGVWKCDKASSAIIIKNNVLESYSCFGNGKSPLYKYTIGDSSIRYFKVENRSGEIKLEGDKIKVYKNNKEITSVRLEWNEKNKSIISDKKSLIETTYTKRNEEIKEVEAIKEPAIGMNKAQVEASTWGVPKKINRTKTQYGVHEQWCYYGNRYIYFEDGIVTSIQD